MPELKRKLFHLLALSYIALYVGAGQRLSAMVLGGLFLGVGTVEALRLHLPRFNDFLLGFFHGIERPEERRRPSGIFWALLGCLLTIVFIPDPDIVVTSMAYLVLGDGVAGFVGKTWGRVRVGDKSLEGSLSCFLVCWFLGSVFLSPSFGSLEILGGALAATLLEAVPLPVNDNFRIPFFSALFLTLMRYGVLF